MPYPPDRIRFLYQWPYVLRRILADLVARIRATVRRPARRLPDWPNPGDLPW